MSYLSTPRIHFAGYFQADVSTINNDVRHFDSARFQPRYQLPQTKEQMNGWWNPEGTGAFRLVQCAITGGRIDGKTLSSAQDDPVIGMTLAGADGRVCGKLVDLDPQQQSVSEIWGMQVRLTDNTQKALFMSGYRVAPFMDLWRRQQGPSQGDQTLASYYQSVLENVEWNNMADSPLLEAIRAASGNGVLSIKFNVFGYKMDSTSPEFTLGNIVGTIGPARQAEPARFVLGRHMMATLPSPVAAAQNIFNFPCVVDADTKTVGADLGNSLPITDGEGTLQDVGELTLAVLKNPATENGDVISASDFVALGTVPYQQAGWYEHTAGVADFSYAGDDWIEQNIGGQPLALLRSSAKNSFTVLVRESMEGLYVRADQYVHRLNPGDSAQVEFYATRYGQPFQGVIALSSNNSMIGGGGSGKQLDPPVPIPKVGEPSDAVSYSPIVTTDVNGRATVTITASKDGPGNPRGYVDGQLYGVGFQLAAQPDGYHSNPWLFISLLVWDHFSTPQEPTWYQDIQPMLQQYGNLYPIMSRHLVDLGDYNSVVEHRDLLKLAFSLPVSDPNYMPVTRDLSRGKRNTLLKWLDSKGSDGLPVKGNTVQRIPREGQAHVATEAIVPEEAEKAARLGGKTAFLESLKHKKPQ